jgi:hypothetical protein
MVECHELEGVEVVAISRKRESHEAKLLQPLLSAGFTEVTSYPLNENRAREALQQMRIAEPTQELIELGRNLLNLEIIGTIREREPLLDFSSITDELDLWEHYRESLLERERSLGKSVSRDVSGGWIGACWWWSGGADSLWGWARVKAV